MGEGCSRFRSEITAEKYPCTFGYELYIVMRSLWLCDSGNVTFA